MIQALIYGAVSGFSLLFGAATGLKYRLSQKAIARFMAFGSGVLICAVTFGLMEEAFEHGGFDAITLGIIFGAIFFVTGDYLVHLKGGRRHKRKPLIESRTDSASGKAITLGAFLDGIPESIALGIALANGQGTGTLMLVAIALSNFPEGISSIEGLVREKFKKKTIYLIWGVVAIAVMIATILSFEYLKGSSQNAIGIIEAFAAGAILAMVADSMIPEAYEEGGFSIGILTVLGFLVAFILSRFT